MTTIVWMKEGNKLIIAWDKRSVWWLEWYNNDTVKVIELDWMLIWTAWTHLNKWYLSELYFQYKKEKDPENLLWITRIFIMWFYKYLLENVECLKDDWSLQMLIMNPYFQIAITNTSQMIEMDSRDMLAIWSWWTIAMWLKAISLNTYEFYKLDIEKIFKLVSLCDIYTSEMFDKLEITMTEIPNEKCTDPNNNI